jgi:glycosyltransferase involved in cell wall biosynthesis
VTTASQLSRLQVRGPFRGLSGYEHLVREFVRELDHQGVLVELVDLPNWSPAKLPDDLRDDWFDTLNTTPRADVVLHICSPFHARPEPDKLNVNYTMFEADRVHPAWVERNKEHDLVIVPTESSQRAWLASGMPSDRIAVCPMGVNTEVFTGHAEPLDIRDAAGRPIGERQVRFLNVSELGPRKNLLGLLRAWLQATTERDDSILVIKLSVPVEAFLDPFRQRIQFLEKSMRKTFAEAAPVVFVYERFSDADMPRLYAAATHYISLSFGEGWDQPMLEAAASGLRLIAPNHSAYSTYLDDSVAHLISSREVPCLFSGWGLVQLFFQNANWWEPDEREAMLAIRSAIEGKDATKTLARERVVQEFTWERATHRLIQLLGGVRSRRTPGRSWFAFGRLARTR